MKNLMTQSLTAAAIFIATPDVAGLSAQRQIDPRVVRLQEFLAGKDCPVQHLAHDFVKAADQNQLDWRLLPSISFVESSGGKYHKNNNIFGWGNGEKRFVSVRQSIYTVADKLASSKWYRHKNRDTDKILTTYNPRPEYRVRVRQVMRQIGPRAYASPRTYAKANYDKLSRSSFR